MKITGSGICEKLIRDVHAARESLGHSNLQTTLRYVKSNVDSLKINQGLITERQEMRDQLEDKV